MFKTDFILANFAFFIKLFLKKIQDDSVVLIPVVQDRLETSMPEFQTILPYRDETNYLSPAISPPKRETSAAQEAMDVFLRRSMPGEGQALALRYRSGT